MEMIDRPCFVFLVFYALTLSLFVATAFCNCQPPCCEHPCSSNFPGANRCQSQPIELCGSIPEVSASPSAPTDIIATNFVHPLENTSTLGLNVTWHLPENVTGLSGFFVHVIKTSYIVGAQFCYRVNFPPLSEAPLNPSEITFSLDCLKVIDVDGLYTITVTSLDSGKSIQRTHHAKSCNEVPEVGGCYDCQGKNCPAILSFDEWEPQPKPSAMATFDGSIWIIVVTFTIYPGNLWLKYRVNLYSYELDKVEDRFSNYVNSSGRRGSMTHEFRDVKPGRYKAKVKIFPGDTWYVSSNDVNITALKDTSPVSMATSPVSLETPEVKRQNRGLLIRDIPTTVGVIASVLVAILLLAGLVAWTVQKKRHHVGGSDSGGNSPGVVVPHLDDRSNLANNMLHNEADKVIKDGQRQLTQTYVDNNRYEWTEGSVGDLCCSTDYDSQFSYIDAKPRVHKLENIDDLDFSELLSVAGKSGESV